MTLHLIYSIAGFDAAARRCAPQDTLVLMGDAVYLARPGNTAPRENVVMLAQDGAVRGIGGQTIVPAIDYPRLVELCVDHHPIVSWND